MEGRPPKYGSLEWRAYQYDQAKKARRGHNYTYHTEELEEKLIASGYQWHTFKEQFEPSDVTPSELVAKEVVEQYRNDGYYARIICGKKQIVQRVKYFSVAYKKKSGKNGGE